jgi:RNA polymerase primary sigma factor
MRRGTVDESLRSTPAPAAAETSSPHPEGVETTETGGESLERYLREVSRWDLLTADAEKQLARRTAKGDREALEDLVNRNLRLVIYWAKRYRSSGLPIQDLIQEGNIGLMRAAEKFDHKKGTRFSTYASWWIRQALARAICDKQDLIRIPVHMHQKMRRVDRLLENSGTLDDPEADVERTVEKSGIVAFKEWESARRLQQPISLDRRQDPDRDGSIEVEDDNAINPMHEVYLREIKESVSDLLDKLPPRHQAVLRLRYGLDDGKEHTLEAIGSRLKISRERVRQIQTEAIERIALMSGLPKPEAPVTRRRASRPAGRLKAVITTRKQTTRRDKRKGRGPARATRLRQRAR